MRLVSRAMNATQASFSLRRIVTSIRSERANVLGVDPTTTPGALRHRFFLGHPGLWDRTPPQWGHFLWFQNSVTKDGLQTLGVPVRDERQEVPLGFLLEQMLLAVQRTLRPPVLAAQAVIAEDHRLPSLDHPAARAFLVQYCEQYGNQNSVSARFCSHHGQ